MRQHRWMRVSGRRGLHTGSPDAPGRPRFSAIVRTALCVEPRGGTLHVFMPPAQLAGRLPRTGRRGGGDGRQARPCRCCIEGYTPPYDHRAQLTSRSRPIPASSRSTCSRLHSGTNSSRTRRRCTRRPRNAARGREVHARRPAHRHRRRQPRRPRRTDAGRQPVPAPARLAHAAWSASGTTTRRCRTCSPACSSARRASPRASTKPGTTLSANSKSRSASYLPPEHATPPAWLVDRLFRHLLIDAHRQHAPRRVLHRQAVSPRHGGRPARPCRAACVRDAAARPHEPASAASPAVAGAWFWRKPYEQKLVRWGTALHDRFMLPHFVDQDFGDVLDELRDQGGYALDPAWFAPHVEFRFPLHRTRDASRRRPGTARGHRAVARARRGSRRRRDGALRRFVGRARAGEGARPDRSAARRHLQWPAGAAASDWHERRVRGRRALSGLAAADLPAPDDRACMRRSCSTCSTPGTTAASAAALITCRTPAAESHETFPVNAREAEGRRIARFFAFGHTPGPVSVPPAERDSDFPFTLDLAPTRSRSCVRAGQMVERHRPRAAHGVQMM